MAVSYRLAPVRSVAQVLRRDCQSGGNFGEGVERPVLLNALALCLVVDEGLAGRADVGIPTGMMDGAAGAALCRWGRTYVSARSPDFR